MKINNRNDIPEFLNEEGLTGYGAEIGVFRAEFSKHFLEKWNGKKLYLIDAWRHFEGVVDISNHHEKGQEENLIATFKSISPYGNKVSLIRDLSTEAARIFPDGYFDFIYFDACHLYQEVIKDLRAWYPKIKTGGYLMGHDYLDGKMIQEGLHSTVFEVKSAVNSFALMNNLKVQIISDGFYPSWYMKK